MNDKNRATIFTSDEQRKLYRNLSKEYKASCFLLSISKELSLECNVEGLDCSVEDIVEARKGEIEGIVSMWSEQIQKDFYRKIKIPTLMKSLPDSYRYEDIKVPYSYKEGETPIFNVKEPKVVTWQDIYNDRDSIVYNYYQYDEDGWISYSKKKAEQTNQEKQNYYKWKLDKFTMAKNKWSSRKLPYDVFMEIDLNTKIKSLLNLPDCFMKDALQYLNELIKIKQQDKPKKGKSTNEYEKSFPYRYDTENLADVSKHGNQEVGGKAIVTIYTNSTDTTYIGKSKEER